MLRRHQKIQLPPDDEQAFDIDADEEDPVLPQRASVEPPLMLDRREGGDRRSGTDEVRTEFQRALAMAREHDNHILPTPAGGWSAGTKLRIGLVALALIAGGSAAWLATRHDPAPSTEIAIQTQAAPVVPLTKVLVASKAIGLGERLSAAAVTWQEWPQAAIRADYITDATTPDAPATMSGEVARDEFVTGEPILAAKLVKTDEGFLSAVLANGMRGVAVSVTPDAASGGFIVPNDHVDVLLTRVTNVGDQSVQTILQNVRVLAINTRLGDTGATGAPPANADPQSPETFSSPAIATLELTSIQSEVIVHAIASGRLSLVLRSLTDSATTVDAQQAAANQQIRMTSPFWNHTDIPGAGK